MKAKSILVCLMFCCFLSYGQQDTTSVPFVAYWAIGDSYDFKITKLKQQWKEGTLSKNDSSSYIVNFLVIDSTATSYKIKWSYKTSLAAFNIPEGMIQKLAKYEMTEVIYETNELGEFVGIENWEAIAKMMNDLLTDLVEVLAEEKGTDKEILRKTMEPIKNIYSTRQGIEYLVFKELQYFHFPFGVEYSVTEPFYYEEQLPNMFGGNPIRGDAKLYIDEVDVEASFCVLIQEMTLNPEDTKEIIANVFKQMGIVNGLQEAMKTAEFNIIDNNRYEYYYYPGIPHKIETNRTSLIDIASEKGKRIEITRIALLYRE